MFWDNYFQRPILSQSYSYSVAMTKSTDGITDIVSLIFSIQVAVDTSDSETVFELWTFGWFFYLFIYEAEEDNAEKWFLQKSAHATQQNRKFFVNKSVYHEVLPIFPFLLNWL